ncbi:MAG: hypothetical protein IBJ11_05835 [Phycisphaerales bacterium]|nr:hypothetical protein [Phycisphaerales bacterium]
MFRTTISVVLAFLAAPAAAQHLGDIQPRIANGRLSVGGISDNGSGAPAFDPTLRAFRAAFGKAPNFTDDPGFDTSGSPFPPAVVIGFDILDALRKWDGCTFTTVPPETLIISRGLAFRTTPAAPGTPVTGFNFATSDPSGGLHVHNNYFLNNPASPGIYLLTLRLTSPTPGVGPSEPFFIVFNQNDTGENHTRALQHAQYVWNNPFGPADLLRDGTRSPENLYLWESLRGASLAPDVNGDCTVDDLDRLAVRNATRSAEPASSLSGR